MTKVCRDTKVGGGRCSVFHDSPCFLDFIAFLCLFSIRFFLFFVYTWDSSLPGVRLLYTQKPDVCSIDHGSLAYERENTHRLFCDLCCELSRNICIHVQLGTTPYYHAVSRRVNGCQGNLSFLLFLVDFITSDRLCIMTNVGQKCVIEFDGKV